MELPGISRFSARQDKYLPASSALGVTVKVLVVTLPSTETDSFAFLRALDPFHQVIVAGGLEPAERQEKSTGLSAETEPLLEDSICTRRGRKLRSTVTEAETGDDMLLLDA